jgi:Transposase IS116/IS110/IS902 family
VSPRTQTNDDASPGTSRASGYRGVQRTRRRAAAPPRGCGSRSRRASRLRPPRSAARGGAWGAPQWGRGSWGGCEFPGRRFRADAGGDARACARNFESDAKLARSAGLAPIPVSSGKTNRHHLDRGGNRQLNAAIHRVAITRGRCHPETQIHITHKTAEGKTHRKAIQCLKRHLAPRKWHPLQPTATQNNSPAQPLDIRAAKAIAGEGPRMTVAVRPLR